LLLSKEHNLLSDKSNEYVPRRTKIFYGVSDLGFALVDTTIAILYAIFLVDVVGLSPGIAAIAIFVGRSWDYINDPIIGHITDRTRTRWGRRRPYLLFGFLPFALAFTMLWWIPPLESQVLLAVYYSIAYFLYDTSVTFVSMPYFCLTPELTLDYDERTTLTSYRMVFSILGGLIAFIVPLAVIGSMRPENINRIFITCALIGLFSALPLLITFFGTRERPEFQAQVQPGLKESLRAAVHNRPFLFASGIFLFTWVALDIVQTMLLFFLKYRMNLEEQSDLVAGTVFIMALLTLPFWEKISRRFDKRLAYIAGMAFLIVVMLTLIIVNPGWGLTVVLLLAALAGIGIGAMHVLPWAIIPDAIEWDELATNERHEGMFYSLVTLFKKIASSIALPLTLLVLDWSGYVSNAPIQTPSAVFAIQAMVGIMPSIFLILGIIFAFVYPLNRERHAQVRNELAARRASAAQLSDS
jgi:GPH family glycoside/pentoside/hexuronide:cation symporter